MTPDEKTDMQRWLYALEEADPELQRMREEKVRATNTMAAFDAFKGVALQYARDHPPEPTSGLVEQQRWFRLFAERQGLIKPAAPPGP
jgi:hypothetical protein